MSETTKWIGLLDITESEMSELTAKPELLHLYNARMIWSDLLAGQSALHELKALREGESNAQ